MAPSATDLLSELIAINSVNPAYGGPGEADLARFMRGQFTKAGLDLAETM